MRVAWNFLIATIGSMQKEVDGANFYSVLLTQLLLTVST